MLSHVVVVGASLAGLRAVETLRIDGFDGRITLVGAEAHLPYDRPPLTKKLLAGELEPERIHLRKEHEYTDLDLDLRLGVRATALDPTERRVALDDGGSVSYDGLLIATGAAPRHLAGQPHLDGVFVLRTLDDSLRLRAAFDARPHRVVVVGAGFIGAEVAATARRGGLAVTVIEALPVPLARGLGLQMGMACAELHRRNDVDLRLGVGVAGIEGTTRVERVRLTDGTAVDADIVVVGIGVAPVTDWLESSGLELRDGVVCDATLAAGPPGVYAAGGDPTPYAPVPFFWSDQYDARIQFLGRGSDTDEVRVVHGSVAEGRFVALYEAAGRLHGVLGISLPRLTMPYRKLLAAAATWDEALAHAASVER